MLGSDGVRTAEHFLGERGTLVVAQAVLIGTILTEDFDATTDVSSDDDVAVGVGTAR